MKAIEIKNLSKKYKDFEIKDLSFDHIEGSVMGLIGANGAGKTTILKSILDIVNHGGEIKIFGQDPDENIKDRIGFLLEDIFISNNINIKQTDNIYKNIYSKWDSEYFYYLTKKFNLPDKKPNDKFSKGMKMKYKIAIALSSRPDLLILDEPTSGLDPVIRDDILDILLEFMEDEKHSILFSSHITEDLEKIADYITYINDGKLVFSKEKYDLLENYAILKCTEEDLEKIDKENILKVKKSEYSIECLVDNKLEMKKKYPDLILDKAHISEIMVLYERGKDYEGPIIKWFILL